MKFKIENGNIILNKVSSFVVCEVCGQNLAINNNGVMLIKTFASLLDVRNNEIILKCGKCKNFNVIKLSEADNKKSKCLLVV